MAMRGSSARTQSTLAIDVRTFGWDRAVSATLRHSTLAFERIDVAPLAGLRELGKRDRLSLVGQFAAHQALLQFAGVSDGEFAADEWAVLQKRGVDCRLLRVAGRRITGDPIPVLTMVQQFASAVESPPIDVLRQSSARADAVYCEIDGRLREDATADLRWFRSAAVGELASPGADVLRSIIDANAGRYQFADASCLASLRMAVDDALVIGESSSPLEKYSGIAPLVSILPDLRALNENEIVERLIDISIRRRLLFAIASVDRLDPSSRRVLELLQASDVGVWIGVDGVEVPESRWFAVSPRVSARHELDERLAAIPRDLRAAKLQQFIASPCFARFLIDGVLPTPQMASPTSTIREPERSYLAAIALLPSRSPVALAQQFLHQFSSAARIEELVFDEVSAIRDGRFEFVSEDMRVAAAEHIPAASRSGLARSAAAMLESSGDAIGASLLFLESDETGTAIRLLESVAWTSSDEAIRVLRAIRSDALTPQLARTLADALIEAGRYRDAREVLPRLEQRDCQIALAQIERRTGDYVSALHRVEQITDRAFAEEMLRAELLVLSGRNDDAVLAYEHCRAATQDERLLLGYHRAVLALDMRAPVRREWLDIAAPKRDYYASRFGMYDAIARHDTETALRFAERATTAARTIAERVDATLDHVFALFTAGRWEEARKSALDALLIIDETQGDRGAGGILFILAFLSADAGHVAHAEHLLMRLRQFYSSVNDQRRLRELTLLTAAIELSRGRFESALAAAESVLAADVSDQIREAAALIADESAAVCGDRADRARGETANLELTDRFLAMRGRGSEVRRPFLRALAAWRQHGGTPPNPTSAADRSLLMRAALCRNAVDLAEGFAHELGISLNRALHAGDTELRALRLAATKDFPYSAHDFAPSQWRFASRNRLGQWAETGSLPPLASAELEQILETGGADWISCSKHEVMYFSGIHRWSDESREALAAIFRTRSEQYRLRRLMQQEESAAPTRSAEAIDGIIGQSPAIHEICELVARVSRRDVPVCILGESGTGKELIARAIHRQSARRTKPFTSVNCAALPENLIESELFGAARGAFTGADRDRAGLVQASDGGTLFLDEIGEMPLTAQAKLLRFLQEGEFRRVGETALRSADVRVISATNRKLETAVEEGRFREDLYYRIRGVEVVVPPLRDRSGDIPLLVANFLESEGKKHRGGPSRLSAEAEAAFASYHWPGNVRELQNAVRAAHAVAGDAKEIQLEHLPPSLQRIRIVRKSAGSYQDAVARFRRDLIEKSLAQAEGNQNQAAAMLKISRQALAYQIRELGILVTPSKRPRV